MAPRIPDALDSLERSSYRLERSEPLPPALLPGWRAIPHAIVRARGEEGYIDLVALHPGKGVALLAFLEKDQVADPEEARTAFAEMLREVELAQRFPGSLPVVALAVAEPADDLDQRLERAFAGESAPTLPPGWVEWLAERLAPGQSAPNQPPPRLAAPLRGDETPPPPTSTLLIAPSREGDEIGRTDATIEAPHPAPPAAPEVEGSRWTQWGISLGFASGIVLALLIVLALFSHTGRLF
jgi:hypothetical protein